MFLWLKLLLLGLALVDMEVFSQEDTSPASVYAHSAENTSPIGDGDNSSMHATTPPSTSIPTNISQAPTDTTSGSIGHMSTTTLKDCGSIHLSLKNFNYTSDGSYAKAQIEIKGADLALLENITCNNSCTWSKKDKGSLSELKPCEQYKIHASVDGCDIPKDIAVPPSLNKVGKVLNASKITNTTVTLSWDITDDFDCKLEFTYCCQLDKKLDWNHCTPHSKYSQNFSMEHLLPNKNYSCISNILFEGKSLYIDTVNIQTDYGKPEKPEGLTVNSSSRSIFISWKKPSNTENGPIHGFKVQINETEPTDVLHTTNFSWHDLNAYKNYTVRVWAYTNNKRKTCIDGEQNSMRAETKAAKPECVTELSAYVSDRGNNAVDITCKKSPSLNGPSALYTLRWENNYANSTKCDFQLNDLFYLTTYTFEVTVFNGQFNSDASKTQVTTKYNSKALITFLAFLIIVTSLALLMVLYKIYILNKEKASNADEGVRLVERDYEKPLMNIEPIPAESLWEAYKRKIADEGRLFLDEFQSIPRVFSKFPIKEARRSYNHNKNRYVDILPYDYNRVELTGIFSDPGSDYINASHIDGFKEPRKYIAAQGPKDETTDDFWRMIWEQKATIVVMVTRCEEKNRIKCAKYWPSVEEETASYGDIVVKINECKMCPDYMIQKLHITNRREKTVGRDVTHIQFTSWPDHGVPDDPHLLLKLRRRVNALSNFFSGPIVVHCSAGVGRTGTYIGIDAMLEGLETEGRVDVYGYVVKLRRQRCLMVQVETQYILIHQALVEYIQYGETEVSISELHNYLNHLKKRDPPSDPSLLEAEFQRLPSYKNWQTQKAGNRNENKTKNRSSTVIPYDYNRILFKHEEEGSRESEQDSNESSDEESDCEEPSRYINASFINGYWLQSPIIATQGPLPETISDFWSMVYQRKVKVIVMLTELKDDTQELCMQYWGEGRQTYDGLTVELKDTNCCSSYTIRVFDLTHMKRKETRKVFQYQYQKWKGFVLPENPKDLVTMIQNIKQKLPAPDLTAETNVHSKNIPLVVHCRDGSQQTGVFCALVNLLDSAETEGVIDVFQVVKSLRRARPGMVSSFEDYQFLYDAIAGLYPAQNGDLQKNKCQEHKVSIENEVEKEEVSLVTTDLCVPVQETRSEVEMHEDSKNKDDSREAESSSNGPSNPVLLEIV